jgi:hypothetical protein
MGGLFSTLSKQLLGNFLLSSGLPALAFVLGFQALIAPLLPERWHVLEAPEALEAEWKTALAAIAVVIVATTLTALNGPIIRLYEGYPLRGSWLGRRMADRHARRAREAEVWLDGARSILRGVDRLAKSDEAGAQQIRAAGGKELGERWQKLRQHLNRVYPESRRSLPTRLGNVIRAFEDYPKDKYGMYGVTVWPRLSAVVETDYARQIGEAKQPFDLMLNGSVVSAALGLLTLVTSLAWPAETMGSLAAGAARAGIVAALVLLSWTCYELALPRAAVWGDMVKSAYDLYRWQLLEALGFSHPPPTMKEEQALWARIGGHMLFGRLSTSQDLEYAPKETEAPEPEEPRWLRLLLAIVSRPSH